jgi:N-acetylmuramic acid 6-phosphate (MurNAc-6-P) etherase
MGIAPFEVVLVLGALSVDLDFSLRRVGSGVARITENQLRRGGSLLYLIATHSGLLNRCDALALTVDEGEDEAETQQ